MLAEKNEVVFKQADITRAIENTQALKMIRLAKDVGCVAAYMDTIIRLFGDDAANTESHKKMFRLWGIAEERGWAIFKNGIWQLTEKGINI